MNEVSPRPSMIESETLVLVAVTAPSCRITSRHQCDGTNPLRSALEDRMVLILLPFTLASDLPRRLRLSRLASALFILQGYVISSFAPRPFPCGRSTAPNAHFTVEACVLHLSPFLRTQARRCRLFGGRCPCYLRRSCSLLRVPYTGRRFLVFGVHPVEDFLLSTGLVVVHALFLGAVTGLSGKEG